MDANIENVRNWFNRIYLGGIPLLMKNDTAFLSFICTLTAVEALAGYRYREEGETCKPGERFRRFVQEYFPKEYAHLAADLWDFRNGMVHGFCPRRFALTEHQSQLHLRPTAAGGTFLNAEDFYSTLLQAARRFFEDLEASDELQATFAARLQSDQGGSIGVGLVEVLEEPQKRWDMRRALINPPLKLGFNDVYKAISEQPKSQTPKLLTTGGVPFVAEAKCTHDGRLFISLPHNNRIYEDDWGYRSNSMGKDGQRIGHYSIPIDNWASRL